MTATFAGCEYFSSDGSTEHEKSLCNSNSHGCLLGGVKCKLKFMICRQIELKFLSLWSLPAIVSVVFYGTWNIINADNLKSTYVAVIMFRNIQHVDCQRKNVIRHGIKNSKTNNHNVHIGQHPVI